MTNAKKIFNICCPDFTNKFLTPFSMRNRAKFRFTYPQIPELACPVAVSISVLAATTEIQYFPLAALVMKGFFL